MTSESAVSIAIALDYAKLYSLSLELK